MKIVVLLLCVARAVSAAAQGIPLGTGEIGPAPGTRAHLAAAARVEGYVAAWVDGRSRGHDVYVARLNARGELLDREGVRVPGASRLDHGDGPLVASDGIDALVVWRGFWDNPGIQSTRVTADEVTPARVIGRNLGYPAALGWAGRHYVLVYSPFDGGVRAMLLDRDGVPASGSVELSSTGRRASIACQGGNCFVAFSNGRVVRGGVIGEALFPRAGETSSIVLPRLFNGRGVIVGTDEQGYYTVGSRQRSRDFIVQRYSGSWPNGGGDGWVARLPHERLPAPSQVVSVPGYFDLTSTAAHDGAIYVAIGSLYNGETAFLRVSALGAEPVAPPPPAKLTGKAVLLSERAGMTVFWADQRLGYSAWWDEHPTQMYMARFGSDAWNGGGTLISSSLARELMPRVVRGDTVLLATWAEQRQSTELLGTLLDVNGRPAGAPFSIARARFMGESVSAFDGERFLVLWLQTDEAPGLFGDWKLYGRFVTNDGQTSESFLITEHPDRTLSLTWNGIDYVVGGGYGAVRIAPSGAVVGHAYLGDFAGVHLAYDPDTRQYSGIGVNYRSSVISAGPQLFASYTPFRADARLQLTTKGEEMPWTPFDDEAPAIAAGGGHSIGIAHDHGAAFGLRIAPRWEVLPYSGGGRLQALWFGAEFLVAAGANLARHHVTDGAVLHVQSLGSDVVQSAIAVASPSSIVAVVQRGRFDYTKDRGSSTRPLPEVELLHVGIPPLP